MLKLRYMEVVVPNGYGRAWKGFPDTIHCTTILFPFEGEKGTPMEGRGERGEEGRGGACSMLTRPLKYTSKHFLNSTGNIVSISDPITFTHSTENAPRFKPASPSPSLSLSLPLSISPSPSLSYSQAQYLSALPTYPQFLFFSPLSLLPSPSLSLEREKNRGPHKSKRCRGRADGERYSTRDVDEGKTHDEEKKGERRIPLFGNMHWAETGRMGNREWGGGRLMKDKQK